MLSPSKNPTIQSLSLEPKVQVKVLFSMQFSAPLLMNWIGRKGSDKRQREFGIVLILTIRWWWLTLKEVTPTRDKKEQYKINNIENIKKKLIVRISCFSHPSNQLMDSADRSTWGFTATNIINNIGAEFEIIWFRTAQKYNFRC